MTDAERLWALCEEGLRGQVSEATWKTWFDGVHPAWADTDEVVLSVPSSLVKERIESRYLPLVRDVVAEATGSSPSVRLVVDPATAAAESAELLDHDSPTNGSSQPPGGAGAGGGDETAGRAPVPSRSAGASSPASVPLNSAFTFDAFVIGTSNRFAHAAARSVAETPGESYNPLYIHGGVGLGKTHLVQAIGNYIREHFGMRNVRYVPSEAFMNEFVDAIRTNTTPAFKRRYREAQVLLVDDIQFMDGKEGLQEEFFHTYNELHDSSRQIVITSDRPPNSFARLDDRLRTRFMSGLTATVQPPDLETRLAILRKKSSNDTVHVPDDVLELIATHVKDNIRELEGALIQVSAFASIHGEHLTVELAEKVLAETLGGNHSRPITPALILDETAKLFGFTVEELRSPSRRRPLVTARQIGMYVFRQLTDHSYPTIAREFGGRDHTTVIHAVNKISGLMRERRQIYDQVNELMNRIKNGA